MLSSYRGAEEHSLETDKATRWTLKPNTYVPCLPGHLCLLLISKQKSCTNVKIGCSCKVTIVNYYYSH